MTYKEFKQNKAEQSKQASEQPKHTITPSRLKTAINKVISMKKVASIDWPTQIAEWRKSHQA